jgi:hypothetical protein
MGVPGVPDIPVFLSQETDHHRAQSRRSQSALRRPAIQTTTKTRMPIPNAMVALVNVVELTRQ